MKKLISIILSACVLLTALTLMPLSAGAASPYYLVGNFNGWSSSNAYKMELHSSFDGAEEYKIVVDLHAGDELKVMSSNTWYPGGTDNNYRVAEDGNYKVFFRPNYDGHSDWHYNAIYLQRLGPISVIDPVDPTAAADPTDPVGDDPVKLLGDADGNGSINVFDGSYILKGVAGTDGYPDYMSLTEYDEPVIIADVDYNGVVNVFDAALILRFAAGDAAAGEYGIGRVIDR